jgi:Txe/YoeB family toxin of Txe-Axe toxin-antitoxin module
VVVRYLNSYDRSFKKLDRTVQERAIGAIDGLLGFFKTRQKPEGLGLKKVHRNYWEIRLDIRNRIIFELDGADVNIVFVGAHDEIKRFLNGV